MSDDRDAWVDLNRAAWDERVPLHVASAFYDNESFVAGRNALRDFEIDEVGDVAGRSLVHLQCHFGQDTLSWARLGATVTGLDFSSAAIDVARDLADRVGVDAEFVCADVYDAVEALGGRQFDIVYTGLGAIVWLPDIVRWARVCAALVRPGGVFYVAEFHPVSNIFNDDDLRAEYPYFDDDATRWDDAGTYTDTDAETTHNVTWQRTHPLGAVITALVEAGLVIEFVHEFDYTLWARWPWLEQRGFSYHLPADRPRIPLMYSIRAHKPPPA